MSDSLHPSLANDHASHAGVGRAEARTRIVVGVTAAMMVLEIAVGKLTGSLALTADGWHMATHAGALGLSALAYAFARRRADDPRYSFGTGKTYALAGYTSAVLLGLVALWMGVESGRRLISPVTIQFAEALPIAVLGLIVNLGCAVLLGVGHDDHAPAGHHHHDHDHDHDHGVGDDHHDRAAQHHAGDHALGHHHAADAGEAPAHPGGHDHNLRSAYLHVIADAFTSVLAIVALLAGRYLHWTVLDPLMGIVGAVVISRWAFDLARGSARQLLDAAIEPLRTERLRSALEAEGTSRVLDLHLWEIGPNRRACVVAVAEHEPREPDHYRARVRAVEDVCHLTVEVHHVRAARDDE
ncbi:MAG: CDF family Co(II)/Ni(II) efflux transporter DmeF [Deltaproteobacteria bacterium]|nr:CDF family Co(II)/Ni(II) efflux transporter DmeF [Deltaproteobacteria bacterium]